MKTTGKRPTTVSEYIKDFDIPAGRKRLREMRACIRAAAPDAKEELKWGMPAYSHRRILVIFGGFKQHIGFFPTGSATRAFKKELAGYKTGRGSIQLPYGNPLPKALIRKITKFRIKESQEKDRKWRSG